MGVFKRLKCWRDGHLWITQDLNDIKNVDEQGIVTIIHLQLVRCAHCGKYNFISNLKELIGVEM